eukprot:7630928-Pyramimonas_sp.AAC.1
MPITSTGMPITSTPMSITSTGMSITSRTNAHNIHTKDCNVRTNARNIHIDAHNVRTNARNVRTYAPQGLECELPASLSRLTGLKHLDISSNKLTGKRPPRITEANDQRDECYAKRCLSNDFDIRFAGCDCLTVALPVGLSAV